MSSNKTAVIVSLALGAALLAGSAYMYVSTQELISTAVKVPGTVVDFERRSSKGGSTDYPVIEFATASGKTHRFTTSGAGDFARGESVEVYYDDSDPANARVNVFIELWLGSLALGAFGLLCLGVGVGTLLYERSRTNSGIDNK
ncbi:MAG: DUF3592 domain-containing protein [Gammaproteobacteria bacterium]|nr:DUF3592 domain-containing protein [Gammaproteobacteria bacterium]MBU1775943.1 DUF3592 domain-containing protein [Gammaproteobacteria bacterium]